MRYVIAASIVLLAAGAAAAPDAVRLTPYRSTILDSKEAMRLSQQCSRISPGPVEHTFEPQPKEIAELESKLGAVLAENLNRARSRFIRSPQDAAFYPKPTDYYRQYAGLIIKGRRVIYVNGLHRENIEEMSVLHAHGFDGANTDWRHYAQMICDGGWLTFGVEYYPDTGTFSDFAFNGAL